MTVSTISRRWAAVAVAGAVVLAACGSDDEGADSTAATTAGTSPTTIEVAGEATPLDGISVVVEDDGSRIVTHARGTTTLPADLPERIVVTGDPLTDSLLSLGVTPTAATADYGSEFTRHLAEELDGVEVIEWVDNGVNIQQLAATQPDLIITEAYGTPDESWDAVSQIAPTVSMGDPWAATSRDVVTALGMVLGLEDEAAAAIAEYDDAVADARAELGGLDGQSLALVLVYPDELRLVNDSNGYLSPVLFGDLELTPYEYPGDPESISPELVGDLAADVVVLQPDFDGTDLLAQVVEQPLVQNLPAAQNDQLFVVDDPLAWQTWSAVGLKANTAFLQDFVALLAA